MKRLTVMLAVGIGLAVVGFHSGKSTAQAPQAGGVEAAEVAEGKEITLDLGHKVTLKLVRVPAGEFLMGSPKDEKDRQEEDGLPPAKWVNGSPQMAVKISKSFYMGVYEVTVDQYGEFMKDTGTKHEGPDFKQAGDHPVAAVSWHEAQAFCQWLSARSGKTVMLPTEAQWEYACRAGTTSRFSFGDKDEDLGDYAWYAGNSMDEAQGVQMTHPVGRKKPNAWGLYDMHGNVWEWCQDVYGEYTGGGTDPTGPADGKLRVVRGGSWGRTPAFCRTTCRRRLSPDGACTVGGFRVAVVDDPAIAPVLEEVEPEKSGS